MYSNKNKNKFKLKLTLIYSIIYAIFIFSFYYIKYIDFNVVRTIHMPILGVSVIAILLDYALLGQVFLISSLFGLIAQYSIYIKQGLEAAKDSSFIYSTIIIMGFIVGFILQMYVKTKDKGKY